MVSGITWLLLTGLYEQRIYPSDILYRIRVKVSNKWERHRGLSIKMVLEIQINDAELKQRVYGVPCIVIRGISGMIANISISCVYHSWNWSRRNWKEQFAGETLNKEGTRSIR
jgi:hypothetical protein